jgi:hypothetical protein
MEFISTFLTDYHITTLLLIISIICIFYLYKMVKTNKIQISILKKDLDVQYDILEQLSRENDNFDLEHNYSKQEVSKSQEKIVIDFQNYLIKNKYSEFTPSGNPSTVYDYSKSRLPKICKRENITLQELADNISKYVKKYDIGGEDSNFGAKSNRAFINALKCFQKFLKEYNSFEDLSFDEEKSNALDTNKTFDSLYESISIDVKAGKITFLNITKITVRNNKIFFGNKLKSQSKENMNFLFDYFIRNNITNVTKYDKDDWFSLISKLTNGQTKTIDYIYYRDFIQELLNRYYKK